MFISNIFIWICKYKTTAIFTRQGRCRIYYECVHVNNEWSFNTCLVSLISLFLLSFCCHHFQRKVKIKIKIVTRVVTRLFRDQLATTVINKIVWRACEIWWWDSFGQWEPRVWDKQKCIIMNIKYLIITQIIFHYIWWTKKIYPAMLIVYQFCYVKRKSILLKNRKNKSFCEQICYTLSTIKYYKCIWQTCVI